MTYRRKLIEVALPLEAISHACAHEKMPGIGAHPRGLHLWWARRPLAACRAVLFASLVDDPSSWPQQFPTEKDQDRERQRLFRLIEELVKWENTNNPTVLDAAKKEILKSTDGNPPPVLDPFCGGGSIPLEAQRLGLKAYASDLNPVAVLITKAMIEIPPRFAGRPPVNPAYRKQHAGARKMQDEGWSGAKGLAEDVRYYGQWMRDEVDRRIGHLYPKVKLPKEQGGGEATVIAWLWARTVKCPNPACGATMPLARSFALSTKAGKNAWVEPVIDKSAKTVRFKVRTGNGSPPDPPKMGRGAKFRCLVCGEPSEDSHIKAEGMAGRMGAQLMAVVAEGRGGRVYVTASDEQERVAKQAVPGWKPDAQLPDNTRWFSPPVFGLRTYGDLFTPRQLVALTTFSGLVGEARERIRADALAAGLPDDGAPLESGGRGAQAYADAAATYLAFAVDRCADFNCALTRWVPSNEKVMNLFARQAIPMVWDFAEANLLADVVGGWQKCVNYIADCVVETPAVQSAGGDVTQLDATAAPLMVAAPLVSTDPPYYDNIGYADLADFFYVWLRRSLGGVYPALFSTLLTPKSQELIATPYRFYGDKQRAQDFFESGLREAFQRMNEVMCYSYPLTVYYAFKQAESEARPDGGSVTTAIASTGWETMLTGLLVSGFQVIGTWPLRSEQSERLIGAGTNALASSVVLVCRPRSDDAPIATRRELTAALHRELPAALRELQQGNIAPVDLAQATIGPGMAVFSRYAKVLEADGSAMRVRTALQLINQELDAYLAEQEGDFDGDTRFCIAWFEQRGMEEGPFGEADVLARAKNTSVEGLVRAGVLLAKAGKVRLLRREEYPDDWNPLEDHRLTVWECAQHLIRALERGGEAEAAKLAARLGGGRSEDARALAYRLYAICERKGWSQEALAYNMLVAAWRDVQAKAAGSAGSMVQGEFDL